MIVANFLWPISFIYVSHHNFSPFQTILVRGTSICITHILLFLYLGISLDFKLSYDLKYLNIRNGLILIHQVIYTGMYFVLSFPLNNSISITGPLFVFGDGRCLTRPRFVAALRLALGAAGIDARLYSGHSFRIGAATTAAIRGIPDSLIKTMGRWQSSAYTLYVRTPTSVLQSVARRLL